MNYIFLLASSLLTAFGIGYTKFFGLGYLSTAVYGGVESKKWVVQVIGALMTIGPFIVYPISVPLAASIKKRYVMTVATIAVVGLLLIGFITGWVGTAWLYLFLVGLIMGIFSVAKMAAVPLEASHSGRSVYSVNAGLTIVFTIGMLMGIFAGTKMYEYDVRTGIFTGIITFGLAGLFSFLCHYPKEASQGLKHSTNTLVEDTCQIIMKYPLFLSTSPLFWGIAGALCMAVTAYAEEMQLGSAQACCLMPLFAAIGIIIGNAISVKLTKHRYSAILISLIIKLVSIMLIPLVIIVAKNLALQSSSIYLMVVFMMVCLGIAFGCCTNLIDAEFLALTAKENKEAAGAALQSIFIAFFTFVIGGIIAFGIILNVIDAKTQFIFLSATTLIGTILVFIMAIKDGFLRNTILVILYWGIKFMLSLRYRVHLKGLENIPNNSKGLLILPNHPAEVDPVLVGLNLWKKFHIRPVVTETFYYLPFINGGLKLVKAFPMADMETSAGYYKQLRIKRTMKEIAQRLDAGDNIMIYPAGHLKRQSLEKIGGASGVASLINGSKSDKLLLVRTRGLWGSCFSTAQTNGLTPDIGKTFAQSMLHILKNLIFFTPKRDVSMEFHLIDTNEFKGKTTLEINQKLEKFYNDGGEEELNLIPYSCWSEELPEVIIEQQQTGKTETVNAPQEVIDAVTNVLVSNCNIDKNLISQEKRLSEDLGMDSLNKAEVMLFLEQEYDLHNLEVQDIKTVADIIHLAANGQQHKETISDELTPKNWVESNTRPKPVVSEGKTLAEAFLNTCERMGNYIAIADDNSGILTWKKLKIATLLMADVIKEYPGDYIGIMLPASVGANLFTIATILAGKVPVMLNWTAGKKNLEHAVDATEMQIILTSGAFLDKLLQADFDGIEDKFILAEEIKKEKIDLKAKLKALLKSYKKTSAILNDYNMADADENQPAVVLFTSGSEAAPKGVPLSHKNLLSNHLASLNAIDMQNDDVIFGYLPPFHSFGLTITGLLPLVTGLKAAYYPNPTESSILAVKTQKWQASYMCGTPSFIKNIVTAARPEQLTSVKAFVCGAEKMPKALPEKITSLGLKATIFEGYGITECSPILTLNNTGSVENGVGPALLDTEILIIDVESHRPLGNNEQGLVLASGPNIFHGYLQNVKDPFLTINDKKWYNTGDLGFLNDNNCLVLSGRLKRFVKLAGEMLSLPAMESVLKEKLITSDDAEGPGLAIEAKEVENEKPEMVLFTTMDIERNEVNKILREAGLGNLAKVSRVEKLEEIPLLGSGKTDYQTLKKMCLNLQ